MKKTREQSGADWWRQMLTRREAGVRMAQLAAGAMIVPSLVAVTGCGDDGTLVEGEALDLQKKKGWNFGAENATLVLTDPSSTDSKGGDAWKQHRNPQTLLADWSVSDARWQPYVVPTLVQSLSQKTLASKIVPVHNALMDEAYNRGLGMREIILSSDKPQETTIVTDLKGPESVAFAAALADIADPVITFDNWPHPEGVVRTQETLGAMLYYAQEVAEKKQARAKALAAATTKALPAVFVLDSDRILARASGADTEFDNRYIAKLPEPAELKKAGTTNVLYAVPDESRREELDDLNDYMAGYRDDGVNVSMLPLTEFRPAEAGATGPSADSLARSSSMSQSSYYYGHHTPYYYGGGIGYVPLFFMNYPTYGYGRGALPPRSRYANVRTYKPNYAPMRRATVFSSRKAGGASGIGRTKPTGFGRVSRSVGGSGGGSGRSYGSYGRSRGGGSM